MWLSGLSIGWCHGGGLGCCHDAAWIPGPGTFIPGGCGQEKKSRTSGDPARWLLKNLNVLYTYFYWKKIKYLQKWCNNKVFKHPYVIFKIFTYIFKTLRKQMAHSHIQDSKITKTSFEFHPKVYKCKPILFLKKVFLWELRCTN